MGGACLKGQPIAVWRGVRSVSLWLRDGVDFVNIFSSPEETVATCGEKSEQNVGSSSVRVLPEFWAASFGQIALPRWKFGLHFLVCR